MDNRNTKYILAKNVRNFRKNKGLSQEELSLELNFDISYIGKLENQKLNITLNRLIAIGDFFGLKVKDLFE